MERTNAETLQLWQSVDRLIDAAQDIDGLVAHGVAPIAAWRWRERGMPVPPAIEDAARRSAFAHLCAPSLLGTIRDLIDGPIILLKGLESARLYPDPLLRPFGDIDLLVHDVATAERRLLNAGFAYAGNVAHRIPGHHHDTPLRKPGLPVAIELHHAPGWLTWMTPPTNADLFTHAIPSSAGIEGVHALPPAPFALFLAAHAWRHGPGTSLLHLIDIALARRQANSQALQALAQDWGMQKLWHATNTLIDAFLSDPPTTLTRLQRLWSRHLTDLRERTVLETYLALWSRGAAAPSTRTAAHTILTDIRVSFTVHDWQDRRLKTRRIASALRRARQPRSSLLTR